jgi:hypothetical protein
MAEESKPKRGLRGRFGSPFGGDKESRVPPPEEPEAEEPEVEREEPEAEREEPEAEREEDAPDTASAPDAAEDADDGGAEDDATTENISDTTAPSIGPNTVIEREDPEKRLARHEQSDTDAMGLDKRREVIGGRYSASVARQATTYGAVVAVIAALVVGAILLVSSADEPPAKYPDKAPWAKDGAKQHTPKPLQ